MVRSPTIADLAESRPRVERCFEAGALATGATLSIADVAPEYAHVAHDAGIVDLYRANALALGRIEFIVDDIDTVIMRAAAAAEAGLPRRKSSDLSKVAPSAPQSPPSTAAIRTLARRCFVPRFPIKVF